MKRGDRLREVEDAAEVIESKCVQLADMLRVSRCTLIYTGAGISTAASIPDYRGPNGVWTLAEQGKRAFECRDPVHSSPTSSHMALRELYKRGVVRHILSQNCDGLHLRSGVPQKSLSEIHGNMHVEVCREGCPTLRQYIRPFDVTKKSQFRRHKTGRVCDHCRTELDDTIVHFGEIGRVQWPLNWTGTTDILEEGSCELIVCLGTSLAVLKQYAFLWPKGDKRTKVVIVNLQWTPKDRVAALKIHAKCDQVLNRVTELLDIPIPDYCRGCDPVLNPRRSVRTAELMTRITECTCQGRARRGRTALADVCATGDDDAGGVLVTPGWWTVGITRTLKRSLSVSSSGNSSAGRRPRKKRRRGKVALKKQRSQMVATGETEAACELAVRDVVDWLVSSVS